MLPASARPDRRHGSGSTAAVRSARGIAIHRSATLIAGVTTRRHGIAVTKPARTLQDLHRTLPQPVFQRAVRRALDLRLISPAGPRQRTGPHPQRAGAALPTPLPPPPPSPAGGERSTRPLRGRLPLARSGRDRRDRRFQAPRQPSRLRVRPSTRCRASAPGLSRPAIHVPAGAGQPGRGRCGSARPPRPEPAGTQPMMDTCPQRPRKRSPPKGSKAKQEARRALPDRRQLARLPGVLRPARVDRHARRAADQRDLRARLDVRQDADRPRPRGRRGLLGRRAGRAASSPTSPTSPSASPARTCSATSGRT